MSDPTIQPASEYEQRHRSRQSELERWQRIDRRISIARFIVMAVFLAIAWAALQQDRLSAGWMIPPLFLFGLLMVAHRRLDGRVSIARRSSDYWQDGLARIEDRWIGRGKTGIRHLDPLHLYAADLDLFGPASLFELLATTRTSAGDDCLASWLLNPASAEEARRRQPAVRELGEDLDFRERLSVQGDLDDDVTASQSLVEWAQRPVPEASLALRLLLVLIALGQIAGLAYWLALSGSVTPLLGFIAIHALTALMTRTRVDASISGAEGAGRDLETLRGLLESIETQSFQTPRLRELCEGLRVNGRTPAQQIGALGRWVDLLDSRRNPLFAPFAALLVWTPQVALGLDGWRRANGSRVEGWIRIAGEIEALAALGAYCYEHPADPFPELNDDGTPTLVGSDVGHPLLPSSACIRNDIRLDSEQRLLIVSGSNMSGKSTFLRTLGVNVVLALAGAPVRATRLALPQLHLGTSIHIHDSLQDGHSRFYSEILRLRSILELAKTESHTLVLLDEILHGTNSHDRKIGAEGALRSLLRSGAIGLITTHDLALAAIAEEGTTPITNVHFEDRIVDGRMIFDYRLRPGIVERSNALDLMRQIGLDV